MYKVLEVLEVLRYINQIKDVGLWVVGYWSDKGNNGKDVGKGVAVTWFNV